MKSIYVFCYLFICFTTHSFAQQKTINGIVLDSLQKPIENVSVVASYNNEQNIISYTTTSNNGTFTLNLSKKKIPKQFDITLRHLSYKTKKITVDINVVNNITIKLSKKQNLLNEVIIKAKKTLEIKGDTIRYTVTGIKKEKDYSVEEALNNIPGISIAENGQISYNGRIISHLYINGVDLLEGRYNIATRGIPADAVEKIDIIKKHNHARIDKGVTASENIAINLKIKKEHSLIFGSSKLDIGAPLLTYKTEITPIFLKDDLQDIASFKSNNFGESLENNGTNLTVGNTNFNRSKLDIPRIIRAPNTNGNSISNKYWLNNQSSSLTNDILLKTNKEVILKAGVNYVTEKNKLTRNSSQIFFINNNSTEVNNSLDNELKKEKFYIGLTQEVNKKELYLKNKFIINNNQENGFSNIIQNQNSITYKYNNQSKSFKNTTTFKTKIKEQIINSGLQLQYINTKSDALVTPPLSFNIIPSNNRDNTNQQVNTNQFLANAYSSYNFDLGTFKTEIKQTINWKKESLISNLNELIFNNSNFPLTSDFELSTFESITSFTASKKFKRFTFTFNPNITYLFLDKIELLQPSLNSKKSFLFFQPRFSFQYDLSPRWYSSISSAIYSRSSDFTGLYNGVILQDYTNLSRNPSSVNITRNISSSFAFGYNNILRDFFFSNRTTTNNSQSDFLLSTSIDNNGLIQTDAIEAPNNRFSISNTTNFTKSFFNFIKIEVEYTYSNLIINQIFNNVAQENTTNIHSIDFTLNIDDNTWYGIRYNGKANFGKIKANGFSNTNTFIKHNIELDFYTSNKTRVNLESESVFSSFSSSSVKNKNTLFNTNFYYKPTKKLFFRASFTNIFNENFFTTSFSNGNTISQSQFSLRPRQFTIGLNFSF